MRIRFLIPFPPNTPTNSANDQLKEGRMLRLLLIVIWIFAAAPGVLGQAPGIDPRGLAAHSAPVIIGVVEEPWQIVIRPDKLAKTSSVKPQSNGTFIVELPQRPLDYLVGYIFRVRILEVLKRDRWVRETKTIQVFAPFRLEGGVSLPTKQRFLLALAPFTPKGNDFEKTSVVKAGQSLSRQGRSFDLLARYYVVAGDANGAIPITDKNQKLIGEIRAEIRAH